jgi:acetate kinase
MVAALGGLDVLAFSGGVGEHQPRLRARIVDGLGFLGLDLDPARNGAATGGDAVIGESTVVVHAREDLVIAAEVRQALGVR